jgi:hypothetical protein
MSDEHLMYLEMLLLPPGPTTGEETLELVNNLLKVKNKEVSGLKFSLSMQHCFLNSTYSKLALIVHITTGNISGTLEWI